MLICVVRVYQYFLSPFVGTQCRFTPTCSQFAVEALNRHGAIRGGFLAIRRLMRCHPWHSGGHDPVPK